MPLPAPNSSVASDPLWYRNAVIYQAHVRSFYDSDGNGIGDFRGLSQKLDYLQDLGISALWLLPFYPSPLRDDGYDIADYYSINPIYGTLDDFREFLDEAHRRSLRVITELVINHTSDQHPWFQRARRAKPGTPERDYYVWSDTSEKYRDARIIFRDFEVSNWTWDPVARAYFWHRFYSHQPDLNFDHPVVHEEIVRVLDFWLELGVDGLRLDAIPYLYEREGTNCENLPETHAYLKTLRKHVDEKYGDRMLLAEANQWPEDAVKYLGEGRGDECHMAFHFPLMPRLFMSVRMEDRTPIIDILDQTPAIPETCQWAMFLRNHDELTLEMVTEEERDYMYRMYAADARARINLGIRRRLAPLLNNDRRRIELLNALLLSMPGTPVIYYGDEIGMGDNIYLGDRARRLFVVAHRGEREAIAAPQQVPDHERRRGEQRQADVIAEFERGIGLDLETAAGADGLPLGEDRADRGADQPGGHREIRALQAQERQRAQEDQQQDDDAADIGVAEHVPGRVERDQHFVDGPEHDRGRDREPDAAPREAVRDRDREQPRHQRGDDAAGDHAEPRIELAVVVQHAEREAGDADIELIAEREQAAVAGEQVPRVAERGEDEERHQDVGEIVVAARERRKHQQPRDQQREQQQPAPSARPGGERGP
jgi:trehalose synthase